LSYRKAAGDEKNRADRMTAFLNLARLGEQKRDYKEAVAALEDYLKLAQDEQEKAAIQRRLDNLQKLAGS
jgi:hypothetical protein